MASRRSPRHVALQVLGRIDAEGAYANLVLRRELDRSGLDDPADILAAAIARPANATTAVDTRRRLHEARGIEPATPDAGARDLGL